MPKMPKMTRILKMFGLNTRRGTAVLWRHTDHCLSTPVHVHREAVHVPVPERNPCAVYGYVYEYECGKPG